MFAVTVAIKTGADVAVGVGRVGVVHVEQPVVGVLAVVTAMIDGWVAGAEVPVIAGAT